MTKSIFKRLSVEDNEHEIPENNFEIEDVIENDSANDEVSELARSVKEDTLSLDNADNTIDELSAIVEKNNEIINSSEPVDVSAVIVAQESLRLAKRLLKVKDSEINLMPSMEAIKDDARTSLIIANEGIVEFIKNLVQSIKLIFVKIGVWIKRIIAELKVIFNMTVSRAEKLKKRLKESKINETKPFNADDTSTISKALAVVILFGVGIHFKADEHIALINYLNLITSTEIPKRIAENIHNILDEIISITKKDMINEQDVDKLRDLIISSVDSKKYANPYLHAITSVVINNPAIHIDKLKSSEYEFSILPIRIDGTNVRGIGYMYPRTNQSVTVIDKLLKTTIINIDASLDSKILDRIYIEVPTKDSIDKILDAIITTGKKTSDYAKDINTHINNLTSDIDKLYKSDFEDKFRDMARRSLISVRKLTTHSFIESILGQVAGTKAVLKYCELSVKKY